MFTGESDHSLNGTFLIVLSVQQCVASAENLGLAPLPQGTHGEGKLHPGLVFQLSDIGSIYILHVCAAVKPVMQYGHFATLLKSPFEIVLNPFSCHTATLWHQLFLCITIRCNSCSSLCVTINMREGISKSNSKRQWPG
jgi:hypothetical protein